MASSSTSSIHKNFKYDVFLSFRGEDIRKSFIDHLHEALRRQGIQTFKDDERLEKGKKINDELLQSIEDSKFYIIVFSKNYASSSWCLNELVKIIECHKTGNQIAYPVFYDVDPTEVRNQSGEVGKAFDIHKEEDDGKWREALKEAGNLAGFVLKNTDDGHEAKFIKKIIKDISLKLPLNVHIDKKMVGMEHRVEKVLLSLKSSIDGVHLIGIKGIGGGGKTALARAIFERLCCEFEGKSFVENVRKVSKESGLPLLQQQVISDVSNEKNIIITSVCHGQKMMKRMLWGKKVLIVLDDVDHIDQLDALAGEPNCLEAGSIIIITTRDEQVLKEHGVMLVHEVDLLADEEASCLFNWYAFREDFPIQGYEELSHEFVLYAAGLPLMIRVLGLFLCSKVKHEWIDQLERLKTKSLKGTLDTLELSYVDLEDDLKEIFLDVACFLKGLRKDEAIRILECCGFHATIGLRVLEMKSLVTISTDQLLCMHDRIQEMGRDIVRRSNPDDPSKHSRLWVREEIEEILAYELGTEETKAIAVDDCLRSEISGKGFENMKYLRFLEMVSKEDENTNQVSENFPKALRYLRWKFYPHCSLPKSFQPINLVALELPECRIKKLWEGEEKKVLEKLRFLVLSHSRLTSLDLGLTPNLEKLDLEECQYLEELRVPGGCLQKLVSLNLTGCSRMNSLSFITQLESLKVLHLSYLFLKKFPYIIPGPGNNVLLELHFRHNNIEELPSSIGNLQKLVQLDLHSCRNLINLPGSICDLRHLRNLELYGCILEELPEEIGRLECLENLNLSFALLRHLPKSICMLKNLITLNLSFCLNLEKLPEDLGHLQCLEKLILAKCPQIRDIPDSICMLKSLKYFNLLDCIELEKLPEGLEVLECLELNIKGTRIKRIHRGIGSSKFSIINEALSSSRTQKVSSHYGGPINHPTHYICNSHKQSFEAVQGPNRSKRPKVENL